MQIIILSYGQLSTTKFHSINNDDFINRSEKADMTLFH